MERWIGRVAVVTGASSGIGSSVAAALVEAGMNVVGCARRVEKIQQMADKLLNQKGKLYAYKCDLSSESDIEAMFDWIENHKDLGRIDVCINNAGMSTAESLLEGNYTNWSKMIGLNVLSLCLCSQLSIRSMQKKNIDDGHVIMISSLYGHRVPSDHPAARFYAATKFAVRGLLEGFRQEVRDLKSNIRVSSLSPGLVVTEFHQQMLQDEEKAKQIHANNMCLQAEDMAKSVLFILGAPAHMEVHDLLVRPTLTS